MFCLIVDAGQICASCTDTERRDTCQHHIECADDEVSGQICASCTDIEGRDTCQHHLDVLMMR